MLIVARHAVAGGGTGLDHGTGLGIHVIDCEAEILVKLLYLPHVGFTTVIVGPAILLLYLEALSLTGIVEPGHVVAH